MTKNPKFPTSELSAERKEQLTQLAKYVVVPAIGYLVVRPLYVHREKITASIQYWKHDKGFTITLAGLQERVAEFSGRFISDDNDVEVESSNMNEEDIAEAGKILSEVPVIEDAGEV